MTKPTPGITPEAWQGILRRDNCIPAFTPTIDDLLNLTYLGQRHAVDYHEWGVDGGVIVLTRAELRPALEAAYDPTMPDWPAMVEVRGGYPVANPEKMEAGAKALPPPTASHDRPTLTNPLPSSEKDFTIEWTPFNGRMTDIRITKGASRYGRIKRFRDWLYHRAPWLPSWVTGWTIIRYRRPTRPFPDA